MPLKNSKKSAHGTAVTTLHRAWEFLALVFIVTACQTAEIPNVQFTGSLGASGAVQFDLLDAKSTRLSLEQFATYWNDIANPLGPAICMRSADWVKLKVDLEELCSWVSGGCTSEQKEALTNFTNEISNIEEKDTN